MSTPDTDTLLRILHLIAPLRPEEMEAISRTILVLTLEKGDLWVREGTVPTEIGFVQKGYLRKFFIRDAKEITDYFYFENAFAGDLPCILSNSPSKANVVAMEPTVLLTLPYATMNALCREHHAIEHVMRVMGERVFATFYYRCLSFTTSSPRERYQQLIYDQPGIWLRAAHYHIASFLGISPQHLSRLSSAM